MKKLLGLMTVLLLVIAVNVNATQITVNDNIIGDTFLSTEIAEFNSVSGSFDINSELNPPEDYNMPYEIVDGSMQFNFYDAYGSSEIQTISWYTSWSGYDNNSYNETFYRDHYTINTNDPEGVSLTVEGYQYDASSGWYSTGFYNSGVSSFTDTDWYTYQHKHWRFGSWHSHSYPLDTDTYVSYFYNKDEGYSGSWTISLGLNDSQLASLSENGILDFTIDASEGDSYYAEGSLTVNVNENPLAPVPEPSTFALLGFGIVSFAGFRRKFKR